METIFHILGIVYYTIALGVLIAEIVRKRKDKESH